MKPLIILVCALCSIYILPAQEESVTFDKIGTLSEELIAVEKDGKWGFANLDNSLVIDFRSDIVAENYTINSKSKSPVFKEGKALVLQLKDGIGYYGYIDKTGKLIIDCQFLNASNFSNGYALVIASKTTKKGRNEYLNKDIIKRSFSEIIIDENGNLVKFIKDLSYVRLTKKQYKKPFSNSHFIGPKQIAAQLADGSWKIINL
ncbi:WG repeat-containing protein [Spongiivirga sp. MCCC 1A20706]|uniref:WG repeat-containing protein n=1 Tax=Spongiivirga sp. MCCC 1A20706 TaxID=3160963 RepID=UPI003977BAFA